MKRLISAIVDGTVKVLEAVMTILLVIMMCSLFWQVFTRFVIKIPAIWTEELSRAAFVYMAVFGAAVGVRRFSHFGMTMISDKFRGIVRDRYFRFVLNGATLIASLAIFYIGMVFTMEFGFTRVSPTFLIPMAWLFASIPLGGFFMALFALYNIFFEDYSADPNLLDA